MGADAAAQGQPEAAGLKGLGFTIYGCRELNAVIFFIRLGFRVQGLGLEWSPLTAAVATPNH